MYHCTGLADTSQSANLAASFRRSTLVLRQPSKASKKKSGAACTSCGYEDSQCLDNSTAEQPNLPVCAPATMQSPQVQHSSAITIEMQMYLSSLPEAERFRCQEALLKAKGAQSSKKQAPPHHVTSTRPPSLSATHPANYAKPMSTPMSKAMPPPPSPGFPTQKLSLVAKSPQLSLSTPSSPPPEPPWRKYTDPMWQTSTDPHFWATNRTILRSDRHIKPGNVVSPTWMIGLPCGGKSSFGYKLSVRLGRDC